MWLIPTAMYCISYILILKILIFLKSRKYLIGNFYIYDTLKYF